MAKRKKKPLVDPRFVNIVFMLSLIPLIVNGFDYIGLFDLPFNIEYVIYAGYGLAFIFEASVVFTWKQILKDGLQGEEIVHIITIIFGATMLIAGGIGLFKGEIPASLQPFVGLGLIIAAILALIQYFLVKNR